jgi:hypothetical protein
VPHELQFFFQRLFSGYWVAEQAIYAVTMVLLCHGFAWRKDRILHRLVDIVVLTIIIMLGNIIVLAAFPNGLFRLSVLLMQGMLLAIYLRLSTSVDKKNAVVLLCSMIACMACVTALAWQGAYLVDGYLEGDQIEPIIRTVLILMLIPCALYLRSCDFGEFESVPRSGVLCIVTCDLCLLLLATVESAWVFTNQEVTMMMTVVYVCMLLVVIGIIRAMYSMCREQEMIIALQAEHQRLLSEREIVGMAAANIDDLRCLRHELKNQYAYMGILLREQRYQELNEYFNQMAAVLPPLMNLADSGNASIDMVLNMELTRAKQAFVPVEYEVCVPPSLPFSADDLCAVLANLMENAIEECVRLRSLGREDVFVRLSIQMYGSYLYIVCRNSTDRQQLERWNDALRTTKSDERLHGYGTRIVMKTAEKYNGTADYSLKDGMFVAKVMLDTMEVGS